MIERRSFMAVMAGGHLATLAAETQTVGKVYRVGILSAANPRSASIYQAFEQRLRELGYVEGQNLAIEFRYAERKVCCIASSASARSRRNIRQSPSTFRECR